MAETASNAEVEAFLADPASHGIAGPVVRIDTHAATVFLAGPTALKIKKPVSFPFLDFSTLALRERTIRRELEINRRFAPALYRRVRRITRETDGGLAFDGDGATVEWVLEMVRFDETATLDHALAQGPLGGAVVADLARMVAGVAAAAPVRDAGPWLDDLSSYIEQNDAAFRADPALFPPSSVAELTAAHRQDFAAVRDLIEERGRLGLIRLGHGDLHAGNIAMIDGRPVAFDAVEFDDLVATGDVLYDAAFLIMDLDERGHRAEACLLVSRLMLDLAATWRRFDPAPVEALVARHLGGLAALPLFLGMRAAIRAKVAAARIGFLDDAAAREHAAAEARRYFAAALGYTAPSDPVLLAIGGLSGTGKSTLAETLAPTIGAAPGALVLRTDRLRKLLAGVDETERLPASAYTVEAGAAVYALIGLAAATALAAGRSVVVDAVAARPEERAAFEGIAKAAEVRFAGLWLDAPAEVLIGRVEARRGDASDADAGVVRQQERYDLGQLDWPRIDAAGAPETVAATARARLAAIGILSGG